MNAVTQESGNNEKQSESGKSRKPKQAASAMGKTKKQAAKNKKSKSVDNRSTGKGPVRKKTTGKKKTAVKKASGRKKTAAKRKPATRRTGASVEKPATATSGARLASLPIDPPPVTFPDAIAAADDPKSLSWMAQQAVSALNAVKAHQAEKGKTIRARVEKNKPEREHASSDEQTGKTADTTGTGTGEPGDAGQLQAHGIEKSAIGSSGKVETADTGTQQVAEKQPALSSGTNRTAPMAASIPGIAAGSPPRTAAKRRYPTRLQAVMAVAIVVPLWLYFGAGDEAVLVATQPEQEIASQPMLEPTDQPASVSVDKPVWQPATAPAQFPEPAPAGQVSENLQSTDSAKPVATSELTGVTAQETGQPVAGTVVTPVHGMADSAPAQPVTPSGYRAPGYGYYPPQPSWQPSPYYRPGYSRPPSR